MAYRQIVFVSLLLSSALVAYSKSCADGSCSSATPHEHQGDLLMQTKMKKDYTKDIRLLQGSSKSLNANLVLNDVEDLVKDFSGKQDKKLPPEMQTAVENFRTLVKDSLTPNLETQHDDGKKEMTNLIDAIKKCNADAATKLDTAKSAENTTDAAAARARSFCQV